MKRASLLLLVTIASGCARVETATIAAEPAPKATSSVVTTSGVAPTSPAALEGAPLERLVLEDGSEAYVAVPVGARDKRAIVVGVHGAGDRADWSCSEWQAVTAGWAFVVCPRGVPHPTYPGTFVWGSAASIAAHADEAVRAVRARYGAWVSDGPLVYGGWSQGASLAGQVIASRPGTYDRAVLVEVGHTPLDASQVAASFVAGGIQRAVVTCESAKCRVFAGDLERAARRRGLPVRIEDLGARGHWFDEPVFRALGPTFVWMIDDQPRFAGLGAAVDARYSTD